MIRREIWLPVEDWPYEVSSFGRVRRTELRNTIKSGWNPNSYIGRIVVPLPDKHGYFTVDLRDGERRLTAKVAQLVCAAFNGAKPTGTCLVRHLDNDRRNNHPKNLSWGTHLDNMRDRLHFGELTLSRIPPKELQKYLVAYSNTKRAVGRIPRGFISKYAIRFGVSNATLWKYANGYCKLVDINIGPWGKGKVYRDPT